ncbi:MAG: FAD-dependent oxidoreductase, partial [Rubrivivax sp.]
GVLHSPRLPLAGGGYWLPAVGGISAFGATAQVDDFDASVRVADHAYNLHRLQMMAPHGPIPAEADLQGRVAWRSVAVDRLPLVGAVPDPARQATASSRLQQLPRLPGLHVLTALGARGIGFAVLGGQVLAAMLSGTPVPLESCLVDALDPGRFGLREARRR